MIDDGELRKFEQALRDAITFAAQPDAASLMADGAGQHLPPSSWALLEHLHRAGQMRVSDLAACDGLDKSTVTPRIQKLERQGMLERTTDPCDRRVSLISLGPQGRDAVERVHAVRRGLLAEALRDADTAQISAATELLSRVAATLQRNLTAIE